MAPTLEWDWDGEDAFKEMRKRFRSKLTKLTEELEDAFEIIGIRWDRAMVRRVSGPLSLDKPKSRGALLSSRRGQAGLRGGFFWQVTGKRSVNTLALAMGNTERHAATHEFGTVGAGGTLPDIRPKKARALAWPVGPALGPSGVPREPGPRSYDDLFFMEFEGGGNVFGGLFEAGDSADDDPVAFFLLARKSAHPPRLGMRDTFEEQRPKWTADIRQAIERALVA